MHTDIKEPGFSSVFICVHLWLTASLRLELSRRLRTADPPILERRALLDLEGRPLRLPVRFVPDAGAMAYHREHVVV